MPKEELRLGAQGAGLSGRCRWFRHRRSRIYRLQDDLLLQIWGPQESVLCPGCSGAPHDSGRQKFLSGMAPGGEHLRERDFGLPPSLFSLVSAWEGDC